MLIVVVARPASLQILHSKVLIPLTRLDTTTTTTTGGDWADDNDDDCGNNTDLRSTAVKIRLEILYGNFARNESRD